VLGKTPGVITLDMLARVSKFESVGS